jgi:sugar lactone lactonase YvrE
MNRRAFAWSLPAGVLALGLPLCACSPASVAAAPAEAGTLVIVAGTGQTGFSGENKPATKSKLDTPIGLAVDALGNLYIADYGNYRVPRVGLDGMLTTFAGTGKSGSTGDNGPAREASVNGPDYVAFDASGNLFIAEVLGQRVRKVSPDGIISTIAGTGKQAKRGLSGLGDGGPALQAVLDRPHGLALDREGNLFIAETYDYRVRKVSRDGIITTVAGTGVQGYSGDGGPATQAMLNLPNGLATDTEGNLYIAEFGEFLASGFGSRVRKVSPDGIITTVAGIGPPGFAGDNGPAREAQLNSPFAVAVDSLGNLFISDWGNHRVRKVSPDGIITTVAGGGTGKPSLDGAPATAVALRTLAGIALDAHGNLYVTESSFDASGGRDYIYKVSGIAAPGLVGSQPFPQPKQ